MMENASFFVAGVEGIDAVFTGHQHLVFPGKKDFQELEGVDTDEGHAAGQARRHGRLLGLAYGPDRPVAGTRRRQWRVVSATSEARPIFERVDNKNQATGRGRRPDRRGAEGGPRGDARLCPPAGRQDLGAALFLFRAGRRRSVGADRQPGADLVHQGPAEGHRIQGPAAAFGGRTLQVGRARRRGLLHRRAGRRRRDQERRRPLSLSQHGAGGRDHRARRSRNGWRCRPASSTRSRRARRTRR